MTKKELEEKVVKLSYEVWQQGESIRNLNSTVYRCKITPERITFKTLFRDLVDSIFRPVVLKRREEDRIRNL